MSSQTPNELVRSIRQVILRDLDLLHKEIALYPGEDSIWTVSKGIANSAGTLCLHLCGNLQHFVGAVLGKSGYVRNRDLEFSARNMPRSELLRGIAATRSAVEQTMSSLSIQQVEGVYPIEMFGGKQSTVFILVHLAGHLNYHLGQVNYHRRLLTTGSA